METTATVTEQLWNIIHNEPHSIRSCVAKEALETEDNPVRFFTNLLSNGCASGMVNSLIYYKDTHTFFDTHYEEIEEIRLEVEEMNGDPISINGDLKNFFSWLAFEQVARYMMDELGLN